MAWMNRQQIRATYVDEEFRRSFGELDALNLLLLSSIVDDGYSPPEGLAEAAYHGLLSNNLVLPIILEHEPDHKERRHEA